MSDRYVVDTYYRVRDTQESLVVQEYLDEDEAYYFAEELNRENNAS